MRPLELDLTAFRSYDRETVDLRGHDLVVITGDTGAGKTSLLDAISFALFGTTPEKATAKDLLTLGRTHGEVRLTFTTRGEVWRMTRRYGPDAPEPSHVLQRLDGDGGAVVETVGGEEAVSARLAGVVGMSFKAFTSAVLLAQGRFAEFLGAQPRVRDEILRELFGVASLEGARVAAGANAAAADREAEVRASEAARLPAHDAASRVATARATRAAAARHAIARGLIPLARAAAAWRADAGAARTRAAAARAAATELPDEDAGAALLARLAAAHEAAAQAAARQDEADRRHAACRERRDALQARHGGAGPELAALRERAEGADRLARDLPGRRGGLAERERVLVERRAALAARATAHAATLAERERAVSAAATAAECLAREDDAARAEAARAEADAGLAAAADAHAEADQALAAADDVHRHLRRQDLAATLRAELDPGDPCPVCGAAIGDHPVEAGDLRAAEADLAAARGAAAAAARAHAAAEERLRGATRAAAVAGERCAAARAALEGLGHAAGTASEAGAALRARAAELDAAAAGSERALSDEEGAVATEAARVEAERARLARDDEELATARRSLGAWGAAEDPAAAIAAALEEVRAAEGAAHDAAEEAARAARAHARAREAVTELESGPVAGVRVLAARVAARGGLEAPDDGLGAADLVAAAVRLRDEALASAGRHERAAARAEAAGTEALAALVAAGAELGVSDASQVDGAARRCAGERDAARAALARVEEAARTARRLRSEESAARAEAAVHRQVANDLRANGFPRFLLNRYGERLAVGASARLQELTGGAYRFSGRDQDALAVVDMRRGERVRRAATLSGGERFLASLALALGLSDVAAESGGRLDCLFLDEGFSTLDADSLEQALAGVERLAGDGRLIAVITHLPGVAERLGASIHVRKDPEGVSRIGES